MRRVPQHRAEKTSVSRQAGRVAASGVAAAAVVAVPLVAAAPADAATDRTWNQLADCESGRNWHINTGNGYYGGLQFSPSTWRGFGGGAYASYAHQASRDQQIRIAERVLDVQGWGAWPACSSRLGLTQDDAHANGDRQQTSGGRQQTSGDRQHTSGVRQQTSGGRQHTYVIKPGDTLTSIARHKDVAGGVDRLFRLNQYRLDGDRHTLFVGNFLRLYDWR